MSFVFAVPETMAAVTSELATIGSNLEMANAAAALPTTGLLAAGADEVSAAIAALFDEHALGYQTISAQASAFHARFMSALNTGAGAYAAAEAANSSPLQALQDLTLNAINAPAQSLFGRPLIGDGANATTPGGNGGAGGILWGNGGAGATGAAMAAPPGSSATVGPVGPAARVPPAASADPAGCCSAMVVRAETAGPRWWSAAPAATAGRAAAPDCSAPVAPAGRADRVHKVPTPSIPARYPRPVRQPRARAAR